MKPPDMSFADFLEKNWTPAIELFRQVEPLLAGHAMSTVAVVTLMMEAAVYLRGMAEEVKEPWEAARPKLLKSVVALLSTGLEKQQARVPKKDYLS